jgi:hypothetical protein
MESKVVLKKMDGWAPTSYSRRSRQNFKSTGFFEAMQISPVRQALPRPVLTRKPYIRFCVLRRGEISQGRINLASSRFRIEEPKTFNIYWILYFLFLFCRMRESHGSDDENSSNKKSRSHYMDATGVGKLNIESFSLFLWSWSHIAAMNAINIALPNNLKRSWNRELFSKEN